MFEEFGFGGRSAGWNDIEQESPNCSIFVLLSIPI